MTPPGRFWSFVVPTPAGCWLWTGLKVAGYGRFSIQNKGIGAHRVSYEALIGAIPDGLELDHLCRVPSCVNPLHLEPVTGAENRRRARASTAKVPPGMTARQRQILEFINASVAERGFPPTLREIGQQFNISSTNGVSDHLKALQKKGFLFKADLKSRGLRSSIDGSPDWRRWVPPAKAFIDEDALGRQVAP